MSGLHEHNISILNCLKKTTESQLPTGPFCPLHIEVWMALHKHILWLLGDKQVWERSRAMIFWMRLGPYELSYLCYHHCTEAHWMPESTYSPVALWRVEGICSRFLQIPRSSNTQVHSIYDIVFANNLTMLLYIINQL